MGASSYAPRRRLERAKLDTPSHLDLTRRDERHLLLDHRELQGAPAAIIGRARTPALPHLGEQLCNVYGRTELLGLSIRVKALPLDFDLIGPPLRRRTVLKLP